MCVCVAMHAREKMAVEGIIVVWVHSTRAHTAYISLFILYAVCVCQFYLHSLVPTMIHRDLKCANVMVSSVLA